MRRQFNPFNQVFIKINKKLRRFTVCRKGNTQAQSKPKETNTHEKW